MKKLQIKKCSLPTCNKEIAEPGKMFCLEHEHQFQDVKLTAKVVGGIALTGLGMAINTVVRKKL